MSTNDTDNDLIVVLSYLCKRQVKLQEALQALGMSRSTYYEQRDKGTLASVQNLVAAADHFGLNKVDLLVRFGHIAQTELIDYLESEGAEIVDSHPPLRTTTVRTETERAPRQRTRRRANLDLPPL